MSSTLSAAEQVKKLLNSPECPPAVLILAEDEVRKLRITAALREKFLGAGGDDTPARLSGAEFNQAALRRLRDESLSGSLFSSSRFFIIDQVEQIRAEEQKELTRLIEELARFPKCGVSIILRGARLAAGSPLYKFCAQREFLAVLPELKGADLNRWVVKELKQNGIEKSPGEVAVILCEIGENRPDEIAKLCEHLALYVDGSAVTIEDLYKVFAAKVSPDEFKLLELLTQGRLGQAEALLSMLMREGKSPFSLLGLLARNFHTYLAIQYLLDQRKSSAEIGEILNIPGWLLSKHLSAVRRYRIASLKRAIEAILRADSKLKNRSVGADAVLSEMASHLSLAR